MVNKTLVLFDLDGTITKKDTFLEFIKFVKGNFWYYLSLLILSPFIFLNILHIVSSDSLKQIFFSYFFKGYKKNILIQYGERFSEEVLPLLCYDDAMKRIKWHQSQNHDIFIITASSPLWLMKWCNNIGVKLIGTNYQVINDCFTGKYNGVNMKGIQKEIFVKQLLSTGQYVLSYGYGNSKDDNYFLRNVNYGYKKIFKK